jgi:predicted nuclease of restriction endonuclease-like (RecB) superfamily
MLSTEKLEPVPVPKVIKDNFLDSYVLEFLNLPERFSEYTLKLIDKNLLKKKLHELTEIAEIQQLSDERNFDDEE